MDLKSGDALEGRLDGLLQRKLPAD
jgi:hypothetical protein